MVQMAFCDLLHTFHKQVANVSQHVFVILLWGILTSPLSRESHVLLSTGSEERGVLGVGSIAVGILSSWQNMKLLCYACINMNVAG